MVKGIPKPVWPVVKDFLLNWLSLAICSPLRSTLAAMILVFVAPAFISPLAVPVRFPPPAFVTTTISGSLPSLFLKSMDNS